MEGPVLFVRAGISAGPLGLRYPSGVIPHPARKLEASLLVFAEDGEESAVFCGGAPDRGRSASPLEPKIQDTGDEIEEK